MTTEELSDVLNILSDEQSRKILQETMERPMSAEELSEVCDISPQSVYRRTDELSSYGLLDTELEYDEDGHHFRTYLADPTQIVIDISEEKTDVAISRQKRMADRFSEFVKQVKDQ
jgi:predicted transcriptional regulator